MDDPLLQLLRNVRRRVVVACVVRALVAGAVSAAVACIASALAGVAWDIHLPAWVPLAALPVAAAAGLACRRPTLLAIAQRIDQHECLDELLSSAVAMGHRDDSTSRALHAMAERAARHIDPRRVPVGMPSAHAALAAGLVLVLASAAASLTSPPAARGEPLTASAAGSARVGAPRSRSSSGTSERTSPTRADAGRHDEGPVADGARAGGPRDAAEPSGNDPGQSAVAADAAGRSRASTPDATTFGRVESAPGEPRDARSTANPPSASTGTRETRGESAADLRHSAGESRLERSAASWRSTTNLAAARAVAGEAIARGTVPVDCRDLVRAYFDLSTDLPATADRTDAAR